MRPHVSTGMPAVRYEDLKRDAATLIRYFAGDKPIRLLTNNPKKVTDLEAMGIGNITRVKHVCGVGASNRGYLSAKRDWGHDIAPEDIET